MPKHVFSAVCENASLDSLTGALSLSKVITGFMISPVPTEQTLVPMKMDVVSVWHRGDPNTPEMATGRLSVQLPHSDAPVQISEFDIDLNGTRKWTRSIGRLEQFVLQGTGTYQLIIEMKLRNETNWTECATIPLDIERNPAEDMPAPSDGSEFSPSP